MSRWPAATAREPERPLHAPTPSSSAPTPATVPRRPGAGGTSLLSSHEARWVSADRAVAQVHARDEAAVRSAFTDPRRVRSALVVLGFVGLRTDRCGRFCLPVRDQAGRTAVWLRDLGLSERTWRRRIEDLAELGLLQGHASAPNSVGIRRTPACRTTTRPAAQSGRDVHLTRRRCECGHWLRWHAGRVDPLCRACHRLSGRARWRARSVPVDRSPTATSDPQPDGNRVLPSQSHNPPQRARSTTRRENRQKAVEVESQLRGSSRLSPCYAGERDRWVTHHRCTRPGCDHPTPSRPADTAPNPFCRCCWHTRHAPAATSADLLTAAGAPADLVAHVAGSAPAPPVADPATAEHHTNNQARLAALLRSRPLKAPPSQQQLRHAAIAATLQRARDTRGPSRSRRDPASIPPWSRLDPVCSPPAGRLHPV